MVWERSGGDERANRLNIMVSILSLKGGRYVGFGGVAQKHYNAPTNVCTIKKMRPQLGWVLWDAGK